MMETDHMIKHGDTWFTPEEWRFYRWRERGTASGIQWKTDGQRWELWSCNKLVGWIRFSQTWKHETVVGGQVVHVATLKGCARRLAAIGLSDVQRQPVGQPRPATSGDDVVEPEDTREKEAA